MKMHLLDIIHYLIMGLIVCAPLVCCFIKNNQSWLFLYIILLIIIVAQWTTNNNYCVLTQWSNLYKKHEKKKALLPVSVEMYYIVIYVLISIATFMLYRKSLCTSA